jgi:hypothetical protein
LLSFKSGDCSLGLDPPVSIGPSATYDLSQLQGLIDPSVVVIFDEFGSVPHEYRAVKDFCSAYCRRWTIVGAINDMWTTAIRFEPHDLGVMAAAGE